MEAQTRIWLRLAAALVLVLGLSGSVAIYRAAENAARSAASDDASGSLFDPDASKQNLRDLQLYGGEANVLAYELSAWWLGLWHGTSAAVIVAATSVVVALAIFFVAERWPFPSS